MKNYKKFMLTIPEIHHSVREVLAETQEEAEVLAKGGVYWEYDKQYCSELYPINCVVSDATETEIEKWKFEREILAGETFTIGNVISIKHQTETNDDTNQD